MKKLVIVAAILAIGLLPVVAGATSLLTEQMLYANGNLVGQSTWAAHSGAGAMPIQVVDGKAVLSQGSGSREDANVMLSAAQSATAKTYAAVLVKVPSVTSLGTGDYFAHFKSATFVFPARIYVGPSAGGGAFTFGLSGTSAGTTPIVFWGSGFALGSTHLIVTSYDAATGATQMWVDPVSEASASIVSLGGAVGDPVNSYALRQGGGTTSTQIIGGILVGTTFEDVVGTVVSTEGSSWGEVKALFR
jgi:hypothetical protein